VVEVVLAAVLMLVVVVVFLVTAPALSFLAMLALIDFLMVVGAISM